MPLGRVLSLLSAQPAALLGLKGRGTLAVGSFADAVVFDPKAEWTYRATESKSKAKNTPFDGWHDAGQSALDGQRRSRRLRVLAVGLTQRKLPFDQLVLTRNNARMSRASSTGFGAPSRATISIARPISSVASTWLGNRPRRTGKSGRVTA